MRQKLKLMKQIHLFKKGFVIFLKGATFSDFFYIRLLNYITSGIQNSFPLFWRIYFQLVTYHHICWKFPHVFCILLCEHTFSLVPGCVPTHHRLTAKRPIVDHHFSIRPRSSQTSTFQITSSSLDSRCSQSERRKITHKMSKNGWDFGMIVIF